jgi:hypothetical protein
MSTPTTARQDSLLSWLADLSRFTPEIADPALAPLTSTRPSWAGRH